MLKTFRLILNYVYYSSYLFISRSYSTLFYRKLVFTQKLITIINYYDIDYRIIKCTVLLIVKRISYYYIVLLLIEQNIKKYILSRQTASLSITFRTYEMHFSSN